MTRLRSGIAPRSHVDHAHGIVINISVSLYAHD
jgi:hypothetical protein